MAKLPKITSLRKTRTASIRSTEQLFHMDSGKRRSFTGYAFSSEDSSFEGFRQSVYRPVNPGRSRLNALHRSNTLTTSTPSGDNSNRLSLLSTFSLSRSRTLPGRLLFSRWSPNPSRSPSPIRPNNESNGSLADDNSQMRRRRGGSSGGEEMELTVISPC
ncbi:6965_t:CDS:1 [Acaulospora morrowiae]|uniref:6965_t:CDS:1 n=1 Tax=Acaulospora morrowiae TaxID=94023 RepID=A0A9N8W933_9GLOM|nr:6965_t:CDS:1 [Acaulospora morrowiae]